jgi:hypothetical protein
MAPPPGNGGSYPRDLPSAGKEIRVNHDVMNDVYEKLKKDLNELEGSGKGTVRYLQIEDRGLVTSVELGKYPAAEQVVAQSVSNAYNKIVSVYDSFLLAYDGVVKALKKSADNHGAAEQANIDSINTHGRSPSTSDAARS